MNDGRKSTFATDFSVGFVLFVATVVVVVALFLVGRPAEIFGSADEYEVLVPSASGINVGSPVLLRGFNVGTVSDIDFEKNASQRSGVILKVSIAKRYTPQIRVNSVAWIQTQGLLGDAAVQIGLGTLDQAVLPAGLRIPFKPRPLINEIAGEEFSENTTFLLQEVMTMLRDLNRGKGTLGQLLQNDELYNNVEQFSKALVQATQQFQEISGEVKSILEDVRSQRGSLGKLIANPSLYDESTQVVEKLNRFLDGVGDATVLGRLASDEDLGNDFRSLFAKLKSSAAKLDRVLTLVDEGRGSLGMLVHDPSIAAGVRDMLVGVSESAVLTNVARNAERVGREAYLRNLRQNEDQRRQILKARAIAAIDASPREKAKPGDTPPAKPVPAAGTPAGKPQAGTARLGKF